MITSGGKLSAVRHPRSRSPRLLCYLTSIAQHEILSHDLPRPSLTLCKSAAEPRPSRASRRCEGGARGRGDSGGGSGGAQRRRWAHVVCHCGQNLESNSFTSFAMHAARYVVLARSSCAGVQRAGLCRELFSKVLCPRNRPTMKTPRNRSRDFCARCRKLSAELSRGGREGHRDGAMRYIVAPGRRAGNGNGAIRRKT